ncbi:MAG: alkaline shock response membrane anchor protein AmaP [Candidatus Omnitrophica bacterium]|nr:alkaline shock response membrane anchor protein AmaP [Candidatus Omnitrophota bacterium]
MRIFGIMVIFIYTLLFSIIGAALIAFSLRTASFDIAIDMIRRLTYAENIKMSMTLTGASLILINIIIAQLSIGSLRKIKTISFENPDGPVTLELSAIEDCVTKLSAGMPEIKKIRSGIAATKRGIDVIIKVTLYSDVNIPEVTEKIQGAIRAKLHEMLGIEEKVTIKVHVAKIVQRDKKSKNKDKETPDKTNPEGFKGEITYGD